MSAALVATSRDEDGLALVDAGTPAHLGVGVAAGLAGIPVYTAMMLFVGAKIVSRTIDTNAKKAIFERVKSESLGNELTDLVFQMIGHQFGQYLRETAKQAVSGGVGAYYVPQPYVPIAGFGAYYVDPVYTPIR